NEQHTTMISTPTTTRSPAPPRCAVPSSRSDTSRSSRRSTATSARSPSTPPSATRTGAPRASRRTSRSASWEQPDGVLPPAADQRPGGGLHLLLGRARLRHHLQVERHPELRAGRVPPPRRLRLPRHRRAGERARGAGAAPPLRVLHLAWARP